MIFSSLTKKNLYGRMIKISGHEHMGVQKGQ